MGSAYAGAHPDIRMTVLRNRVPPGLRRQPEDRVPFAIDHGFDFVVLLHGDGQYAPRSCRDFIDAAGDGDADAVLGSRMMEQGAALRGGMPLYKYVGNRILTRLRTSCWARSSPSFTAATACTRCARCGAALSPQHQRLPLRHRDHHPAAERRLPHHRTAHPDLLRRRDLPRQRHPLRQGGRARDPSQHRPPRGAALPATLRRQPGDNRTTSSSSATPARHAGRWPRCPPGRSVLDIGSGPGGIARELAKKGCDVAVVDRSRPTCLREHPVSPSRTSTTLCPSMCPRTGTCSCSTSSSTCIARASSGTPARPTRHAPKTLVLTTGNVAFVMQRLMLLIGQFNYGKKGILDHTHTRLSPSAARASCCATAASTSRRSVGCRRRSQGPGQRTARARPARPISP